MANVESDPQETILETTTLMMVLELPRHIPRQEVALRRLSALFMSLAS